MKERVAGKDPREAFAGVGRREFLVMREVKELAEVKERVVIAEALEGPVVVDQEDGEGEGQENGEEDSLGPGHVRHDSGKGG